VLAIPEDPRMKRACAWLGLIAAALAPAPAWSLALIVDPLDTPATVQAGDTVSFSFAFRLEPGESILATQVELSIPLLTDFAFPSASGITGVDPWDLTSTFALKYNGNPMWAHVENAFGDDPAGVTFDEVGGIAPLGRFRARAVYNGEIVLTPLIWIVDRLDRIGPHGAEWTELPMDPAYAHIHTGITIVGGLDLPPPVVEPPVPPPPPPPPGDPGGQGGGTNSAPEPSALALACLAALGLAFRRVRSARATSAPRGWLAGEPRGRAAQPAAGQICARSGPRPASRRRSTATSARLQSPAVPITEQRAASPGVSGLPVGFAR
jgi:hypothetical protein